MDEMVKEEFEEFLASKLPEQTLDVLDEIVVQYLTSVLEMLDQDDSFNIEEFILMMDAYIPGFSNIPSNSVFSWMIDLADKLMNTRKVNVEGNSELSSSAKDCLPSVLERDLSPNKEIKKTKAEASSSKLNGTEDDSERHPAPNTNPEPEKRFNSTVQILCELFPSATSLEVRRCLSVANGDADEAARLMLISRDDSEAPDDGEHYRLADSNPKPHQVSAKRLNLREGELEEIKSKLVSRYGFVEVTDDQRHHQPFLPKQEEKKLIRYRENQVVSTKGERFLLEKKRETEEEKKTYVNLKPARKYRFH